MTQNYLLDNDLRSSGATLYPVASHEAVQGNMTYHGDGFQALNKPQDDIQFLLDKYGIRRKVLIEDQGYFSELTNKRCWRDLGVTGEDWDILEGYCRYNGLELYDRPYPNTRFTSESAESVNSNSPKINVNAKMDALKQKYAKKEAVEASIEQVKLETPVPIVNKTVNSGVGDVESTKVPDQSKNIVLKKKLLKILRESGVKVCNGRSLDVCERKMIENNLILK